MVKVLSIFGAGGHGRVIADIARILHCWDYIQFFDDRVSGRIPGAEWQIAGTIKQGENLIDDTCNCGIVGIGNNPLRLRVQDTLDKAGWHIGTVVHPSAVLSPASKLGSGTVVMPGAIVNTGSKVGKSCIINTNSSIDHDCRLGDGVHISPGATITGGVTIGDLCWIGAGSTLLEGVRIGFNTTVGAGAVVIRDIPDNVTCVGNPARIVNKQRN